MIKKIFHFIAKNFVFVGGLLFIFAIGLTFSFLKVDSWLVRIIFLIFALGWILFLIKYFWDLMDKNQKGPDK
jgi:hypothetical protein